MKKRLNYIDFLKFIGITGIFIAHVNPPRTFVMIRSFDVPMMVILSAFLGKISYRKYHGFPNGVLHYYRDRIKRLVIPTWLFLLIYFLIERFIGGQQRPARYYFDSFLLTRYGVGYVWIILIYLYSALMVPIFSELYFSFKSFFVLLGVYFLYELAFRYKLGVDNKLFDTVFYYLIPYGGILTYLGCNYHRMSRKIKRIIFLMAFMIYLIGVAYYWHKYGAFQAVQQYKYPPRIYYLSYGIAVTFGLMYFCECNCFSIYRNPVITYVSKHSMWIYLWHVLVLWFYDFWRFPEIWHIKLIVVYAYAAVIVFLVNQLLGIIQVKTQSGLLKYLKG